MQQKQKESQADPQEKRASLLIGLYQLFSPPKDILCQYGAFRTLHGNAFFCTLIYSLFFRLAFLNLSQDLSSGLRVSEGCPSNKGCPSTFQSSRRMPFYLNCPSIRENTVSSHVSYASYNPRRNNCRRRGITPLLCALIRNRTPSKVGQSLLNPSSR